MREVVFDIECDGLLEEASKIHCLGYRYLDEEDVHIVTNAQEIIKFFSQEGVVFIGHNIILYDLRVVEKLLGINIPYVKCKDTLSISYYLYEDRIEHGLESFGKDVGIEKVKVDKEQWKEGNISLMIERVTEDVKINFLVYKEQVNLLKNLYEESDIDRVWRYFSFKCDCIKEQEEVGVRLDIDLINKEIDRLSPLLEEKSSILKTVMPPVIIRNTKTPPIKMYKKDGTLSVIGQKWSDLLKERGLPETYMGEVEVIAGTEEPNPTSTKQKKDWLFSLGWKPEHIKFVRDKKKKTVSQIPQIMSKEDNKLLCPSVLKLAGEHPEIKELEGYTIIAHRLTIFKGFLRDQKEGRVFPSALGFTSTFRLKHRIIQNLPSVYANYAENIRASLISDEGCILFGIDLKGIEDATKRHYIYPIDPDYVKSQMSDDFDPHLDIGKIANLITEEEEKFYKEFKKKIKNKEAVSKEEEDKWGLIDQARHRAKTTNFSCTYLVGANTLSNTLGISKNEAADLISAYWERNWSLKKFSSTLEMKEAFSLDKMRKFVFNPISKFWMPLRDEKDVFSAVNQSTAVYIFDLFLMFIRSKGVKVCFQYHDELLVNILDLENKKEEFIKILEYSMNKVNKTLKLNLPMGYSYSEGYRYSEVH